MTGRESMSKKLIDVIQNLFDNELKAKDFNLDGKPREKNVLIYFLLTMNKMMDKFLTEKNS